MRIEPLEGKMKICIDGEILECGSIKVEIISNGINMIVPENIEIVSNAVDMIAAK